MVTKLSNTVVDTMAESQFRYDEAASSGLDVVITPGRLVEIDPDGVIEYPETTFALTDAAVNYVWLDFDNTPATLESGTIKPSSNIMLVYQFVTAAGVVSSYTDYRWKTVNNRFLQDPFWPATETQYQIFTSNQNGGFAKNNIILLGLGTSQERYFVSNPDFGSERVFHGDSTSGAWAYGFWKSWSPDEKYLVGHSNVNGASAEGIRVFKRRTTGGGFDFDWVDQANIDPPIDNSDVPVLRQIHYCEYNPVYKELVLSSGIEWWVYEDNDDDTFTCLRPNQSFDTIPQGSGARNQRSQVFSSDGEYFMSVYSGGTAIEFYERSGSGARYQQTNTLSGGDYPGTNSGRCTYDVGNNEFVVKNTNHSDNTLMWGFEWNGSSGEWEEAWEINSGNTDWEYDSGDPDNTIGVNVTVRSVFTTPDGTWLIVFSDTTGSGATQSDNHFIFKRNEALSQKWELTTMKLPELDEKGSTGGVANLLDADENYFVASGASVPITWWIYQWDDDNITAVRQLQGDKPGDNSELDSSCAPWMPVRKDTVTRVADSILLPYNPYHYQTLDFDIGSNALYADHRVTTMGNAEEVSADRQSIVPLQQQDISLPSNETYLNAGPIANTYSVEIADNMNLSSDNGQWDQGHYFQNGSLTTNNNGYTGSFVLVWRTPTSWPAATDSATVMRKVISFGETSFPGLTGATLALGYRVNNAGANANLAWGVSRDNSTHEYALFESQTDLDLDQWYVTVVLQRADGTGPAIYNNSVLQDMEFTSSLSSAIGGLNWWFNISDLNKRFIIGNGLAVATNSTAGSRVCAWALYENVLRTQDISRITSEFGL